MPDNIYNQNSFFDTQYVKQDITKIYDSFASEIERYRSRYNTPEQSKFKFEEKAIESITHAGLINREPQESYCNTFYRLLGLPICSDLGSYNPGFDPNLNLSEDLRNKRYQVAAGLSEGTLKLLDARETWSKSRLAIYAKENDISSALAYSVQFSRELSMMKEGNESSPLDEGEAQTKEYTVRENVKQLYPTAQFSGSDLKSLKAIQHIIKPFIVDPRIDLTVLPAINKIGTPFLTDKERILNRDTTFSRPMIEKVCRVRFNVANKNVDFKDLQKSIDQIKKDERFTSQRLMDLLGGASKLYRSEVFIVQNLFVLLKTVTDQLFESQRELSRTTSNITWKPKPSAKGITAGISSYDLDTSSATLTPDELEISRLTKEKLIADTEFEIFKKQIGGTVFSAIDEVALGSFGPNVPTVYEQKITNITNRRNDFARKSESALFNIAMIMGDDTGFGLLDMLTTYIALWTVDHAILLDMLDDAAFERMYKNPELQSEKVKDRKSKGSRTLGSLAVLTGYETQVRRIFTIIDAIYKGKTTNS